MLVIAFAGLVVVTQYTNAIDNICQSVPKLVQAPTYGLRYLPDYNLYESPTAQYKSFLEQQFGSHVAQSSNTAVLLSM
jgi:hypothetical protein